MLPVIAIVGRPNVGKSTLFNRLTKSRDAIVADVPGLTRDRQYGQGNVGEKPFIVIDTGGIGEESGEIDELMSQQSLQAIEEASSIIFLVDGKAGLTASDQAIANLLRRFDKKVHLVVNKIDGVDEDVAASDFYQLGFGESYRIAAAHNRGIALLVEELLSDYQPSDLDPGLDHRGIKLAIVGRPNVGKSTLVNRMLGEDRVVVFDMPGTTRDSIFIPLERHGKEYTLIDTAGVRRRSRVDEAIEKFSVIKTLQAIEECHVVIVIIDASEGLTEQDMHLLGFIVDAGKALVLAVNKWDGLEHDHREYVRRELSRRLDFVDFATTHFISALHGTGVGDLFNSVERAYESATRPISTPEVSRILESAIVEHQPPLVKGRRIKLRYAHAGGHNPPIIVIHGNQTDHVPDTYKRYLIHTFRKALRLEGTPIRLQFKNGTNPFSHKKNTLTVSQQRKRKRLLRHVKKK